MRDRAGRQDQDLLPRAEPRRAGVDRPGGVQRLARPGRQIFQEDPMLLLHRADAESRARTVDMPVVFFVDPQARARTPTPRTSTRSRLSYTFYPVETAARGPLEPLANATREAARHGRDEATTIIIWSIPIRGRSSARRAAASCSAAWSCGCTRIRYGESVFALGVLGVLDHHVQLVVEHDPRSAQPAITRRSSSFTCATA